MSQRRGRTPKRIEQEVEEETSIITSNSRRRSKSVTKSKSETTIKKSNGKATPLRSNSKTRNTNDKNENSNTPTNKNVKGVKTPTTRNRSQSKHRTVTFEIPIETKTQENEFNNNIYQLITFILGTINISYVIQHILFLAKSFASLSPWMFTFEMTDELNLTFYVAEEEFQETETEDSLYEQLRIQPTAFGYYLRASLWLVMAQ